MRKLQHLYCSPLGCIRDGISVEHFASRIVKFQRATQSFAHIIVYNGKYDQMLKNGLSFSAFITELQQAIYNNNNSSELELSGSLGASGADRVAKEQSAASLTAGSIICGTPTSTSGGERITEVQQSVSTASMCSVSSEVLSDESEGSSNCTSFLVNQCLFTQQP